MEIVRTLREKFKKIKDTRLQYTIYYGCYYNIQTNKTVCTRIQTAFVLRSFKHDNLRVEI